jgi:polyisoprenoid-binding protein YceI
MTAPCLGRTPARSPRIIRATLIWFGLILSFASASTAQKPAPILLRLDPTTTNICWTLNTNVHTVHGTFKLKSGDVKVDPASGDSTGLIVIDATSGESGESARDKRMHSAILESAQYPTIAFRPTHVEGRIDLVAGGLLTVTGAFSLHGQEHPLRITINLQPQKPGSQPPSSALSTRFAIPFVAWGLKDPSTFIFRTDKEVALDIDAIATLAATN